MSENQLLAKKIKELRKLTGAGVMNCREVLKETKGDIKKAQELLRKKGVDILRKKEKRATKEGLIDSYIHTGGGIGVLVEVNCETDFVTKNSDFKDFVHNIAMHIAAINPFYISRKDISQEVVLKEKENYKDELKSAGKLERDVEKIVDGKLEDFYSASCLLEQPYIKNPEITVQDYLGEIVSKLGENIVIKRFVRYQVGESE